MNSLKCISLISELFVSLSFAESLMGSASEDEEDEEPHIRGPPLGLGPLTNGPDSGTPLGQSDLSVQSISTDSKTGHDDSDQVISHKFIAKLNNIITLLVILRVPWMAIQTVETQERTRAPTMAEVVRRDAVQGLQSRRNNWRSSRRPSVKHRNRQDTYESSWRRRLGYR